MKHRHITSLQTNCTNRTPRAKGNGSPFNLGGRFNSNPHPVPDDHKFHQDNCDRYGAIEATDAPT